MKRFRLTRRDLAVIAVGAVLAGGGVYGYGQTTGGGAAPGTANLWVDTNGGTCTRQSPAGSYSDAGACSSLTAAYNAASGGDTINVRCGTYGAQTVPSRSLGTSVVTIHKDPGDSGCSRVTLTGGLDITTSYVSVGGFTNVGPTSAEHSMEIGGSGVNHVTLTDFATNWSKTGTGGTAISNITYSHGTIGPNDPSSGPTTPCETLPDPTTNSEQDGLQFWSLVSNVTINDVLFDTIHNVDYDIGGVNGCGAHTDAIQGFGYNHWLVENSRFKDDDTCILAYSQSDSNPDQVDTITVQNNVFTGSGAQNHCVSLGNNASTGSKCGADNLNNIIQNNTFFGNVVGYDIDVSCGTGSPDGIVRGNIFLDDSAANACTNGGINIDVQWDYNVFNNAGDASCYSTAHASHCGPSFAGGGPTITAYDLSSSDTCAKNTIASAAGTYPSTDIHGTSRPQGANADAGAMEVVGG